MTPLRASSLTVLITASEKLRASKAQAARLNSWSADARTKMVFETR